MCVWRIRSELSRFGRDQDGSITAFTIMTFLLMVVSAGMAIDFMRHETYRTELQDAVDRGVLAAASFSQTLDPEDTVESYLRSTKYVKEGYSLSVDDVITGTQRDITADVTYELRTFFLKIIGIDTLTVAASGRALDIRKHIEISLALDISTSMVINTTGGTTDTRLDVMQSSAVNFVNSVLNGASNADTTISLIPFAGQVNPGPTAFDYLRSSEVHAHSDCVELESFDYNTTTLPPYRSLNQMQFFQFSIDSDTDPTTTVNPNINPLVDWGWCPADSQRIEYFSDNATTLAARINGLHTHEATGTQNAMKWATMLLDPTTRDMTDDLALAGEMSASHTDRPVDYGTADSLKFVIIMSDGNTTLQKRLKSHKYDSTSERDFYANNFSTSQWSDFETTTATTTARQQFLDTCTAAKQAGIVVFTIGFDIADGSDAETDMEACASSASHFFDVNGTELFDAFEEIAATIQKLKLVM